MMSGLLAGNPGRNSKTAARKTGFLISHRGLNLESPVNSGGYLFRTFPGFSSIHTHKEPHPDHPFIFFPGKLDS